jgi:hypothetical protein
MLIPLRCSEDTSYCHITSIAGLATYVNYPAIYPLHLLGSQSVVALKTV